VEKWREVYLRKIKTKAFNKSDFIGAFEAVLEDEETTHENIDKRFVGDQIIWHWECLNDKGHADYDLPSGVKLNYKNVANHLLRNYFVKEDFTDWYLGLGCVKIEEDIIGGCERVILC